MEDLNSTHQENRPEPSTAAAPPSSDHQFSSFLFWREPLPSIEDDLLEMLVSWERVHSETRTRSHVTSSF